MTDYKEDEFYARDRAVVEAARGNSQAAQAIRQAQNDKWKREHRSPEGPKDSAS